MSKRYQVVGALALVTQNTVNGPMKMQLYKGAIFGAGATDLEIEHNLSIGLIRELPAEGVPGLNADGEPVLDLAEALSTANGNTKPEAKDAEPKAKAKTAAEEPEKPARNAAKPNLVAWLVEHRGADEAEAGKLTKDDLWARIDGPADEASDDEADLAELRERAIAEGFGEEQVNQASADELRGLLS